MSEANLYVYDILYHSLVGQCIAFPYLLAGRSSYERCLQRVQVRRLCRPCLNVSYGYVAILSSPHFLSVGVKQSVFHDHVARRSGIYMQLSVAVVVYEVCRYAYVVDVCLSITAVQIAVACHAAESPEVLILTPRAVAPAEHLEGYKVLSLINIRCNIKLGSHFRVFCIASKLAVHPQIDARRNAAEVCYHLSAVPILGYIYHPSVTSHMIVFYRHGWRCSVEVSSPGVADVQVDRVAVSVQFPYTWHSHASPRSVVVVCTIEIAWSLVCVSHPVEFPVAVERHISSVVSVSLPSRHCVVVGYKRCVQRQTVDVVDIHIVPFGHCRLIVGKADYCRHNSNNQQRESLFHNSFFLYSAAKILLFLQITKPYKKEQPFHNACSQNW